MEQGVHRRSHGKYMQNDKTYLVKCQNDGYVFDMSEDNAVKGNGCPVCNNRVIIKGINDISTTHPWMLDYFVDSNDAYTNYASSTKRILQKCPACGEIKESRISNLLYFGFSCNRCSDGISYPNKFGYLLLKELEVDFQREVKFDWCIFPNFKNKEKFSYGIYDFVIKSHKLIIEMDGGIGHGNKPMTINLTKILSDKETEYIDEMKNKLAISHGYHIVRIDCDYNSILSRGKYIQHSILHSQLNNYFDFSNIDFDYLDQVAAETNFFKSSYTYWNQGISSYEIADKLNLCRVTIRQYLKLGTSMNLCDYSHKIDSIRKKEYTKVLHGGIAV